MEWTSAAAIFELTEKEREQLEAAPFNAPPEHWQEFAAHMADQVLKAYGEGEIAFERMIAVTRSCSLGCKLSDQLSLLALVAVQGLRISPKKRKRPRHPEWVRRSACSLVDMLRKDSPKEPFAPSSYSGDSGIFKMARQWLIAAGLFEGVKPVSARRLYDWYCEIRKADGHTLKRGRPRKRKMRPK